MWCVKLELSSLLPGTMLFVAWKVNLLCNKVLNLQGILQTCPDPSHYWKVINQIASVCFLLRTSCYFWPVHLFHCQQCFILCKWCWKLSRYSVCFSRQKSKTLFWNHITCNTDVFNVRYSCPQLKWFFFGRKTKYVECLSLFYKWYYPIEILVNVCRLKDFNIWFVESTSFKVFEFLDSLVLYGYSSYSRRTRHSNPIPMNINGN